MAMTATMPNDTAIGTLIRTNNRTAPNRPSMIMMDLRSDQAIGQSRRRICLIRRPDQIDKVNHLGYPDQTRRNRDGRMHTIDWHPRQSHQGIPGKEGYEFPAHTTQ